MDAGQGSELTMKKVECNWSEEDGFSCTLCSQAHVGVNLVLKGDKHYFIHSACAKVHPIPNSDSSIEIILTEPVPFEIVMKALDQTLQFGQATFYSRKFQFKKNVPIFIEDLFMNGPSWPCCWAAVQVLGPYVKETQPWRTSI